MEKEEIIKRTRIMLGVVAELNDESLNEAYNTAVEDFGLFSKLSSNSEERLNQMKDIWIKKYTLAVAKEILGRIREQYENIPGYQKDSGSLIRESMEEKIFLLDFVLIAQ